MLTLIPKADPAGYPVYRLISKADPAGYPAIVASTTTTPVSGILAQYPLNAHGLADARAARDRIRARIEEVEALKDQHESLQEEFSALPCDSDLRESYAIELANLADAIRWNCGG